MRILFINDVGFQYGAGIAHLRQIQSFLLLGNEVAAFCWRQGIEEERAAFTPRAPHGWLGTRQFPHLHVDSGCDESEITSTLVKAARTAAPDVVVVGNLHVARWPVSLIGGLRRAGMRVVAFMHDGYLISGRCAYPGECRLFESGCNESCPTAHEYPSLAPTQIAQAWWTRRQVLNGTSGVALAANSQWTLNLARRALPSLSQTAVLYYGLDERLFRPLDRSLARRLLAVPEDRFVVATGAVDLMDRRKGGRALKTVMESVGEAAHFIVFGRAPSDLPRAQAVGFCRDFRYMPIVYSAADVFLGASLEEAFGQTFCEAAACGLPVIAFRVGGVPEVARHDVNARLADPPEAAGLEAELRLLMRDEALRRELGRAGRALVEAEFTLRRQGERWMSFLRTTPPT